MTKSVCKMQKERVLAPVFYYRI